MKNVNETMKRWLVSVLSVAMLVTSVPLPAYAEELNLMDEAVTDAVVTEEAADVALDEAVIDSTENGDSSKELLMEEEAVDTEDIILNTEALEEELTVPENTEEELLSVPEENTEEPVLAEGEEANKNDKVSDFWALVKNPGEEYKEVDILKEPNLILDGAEIKFFYDVFEPMYFDAEDISANNVTVDFDGYVLHGEMVVAEGYTVNLVNTNSQNQVQYFKPSCTCSPVDSTAPGAFEVVRGGISLNGIISNNGVLNIGENVAIAGCNYVAVINYGELNTEKAVFSNDSLLYFPFMGFDKPIIDNKGTFNAKNTSFYYCGDVLCINEGEFNLSGKTEIRNCGSIMNSGSLCMSDEAKILSDDFETHCIIQENDKAQFVMKDKAKIVGNRNEYSIGLELKAGKADIGDNAEIASMGTGIKLCSSNILTIKGKAAVIENNANVVLDPYNEGDLISFNIASGYAGSVGITYDGEFRSDLYFTQGGSDKYKTMLEGGKIFSDNDAIKVQYDSTNKKLYLHRDTVVKIGEKSYYTLADAVKDVPDNGESITDKSKDDKNATTITLTSDIAESNDYVEIGGGDETNVYQNVIIDLNGHMLANFIKVKNGSKLQIKDSQPKAKSQYKLIKVEDAESSTGYSYKIVKAGKGDKDAIVGGFLTGYITGKSQGNGILCNYGITNLTSGQVIGYDDSYAPVYSAGKLNISNFAFRNCPVYSAPGVIYNIGGTLNITDGVVFENCSGDNGGAICSEYGKVNISGKVSFKDCCSSSGGAVCAVNSMLNISGIRENKVSFENCVATDKSDNPCGGAIYYCIDSSDPISENIIFIDNATFKACKAVTDHNDCYSSGGAICTEGTSATNYKGLIQNTTFTDCSAEGVSSVYGGVLYNSYIDFKLDNVSIKNCSAKSSQEIVFGGAIYSYNNALLELNNSTITGGTYEAAGMSGGAIDYYSGNGIQQQLNLSGNTKINGIKFKNIKNILGNESYICGGAIYTEADLHLTDNVEISDCVANVSKINTYYCGIYGAVYVAGSICIIDKNASIKNNSMTTDCNYSYIYGSGLYAEKCDLVISDNAAITGNKASNANGAMTAGGVYIKNPYSQKVVISDSAKITENMADKVNSNLCLYCNGDNAISLNIAEKFKGNIGVSLMDDPYDDYSVGDKVYITDGISKDITKYVKSDLDNYKLNYDDTNKKLYLDRHKEQWVLEVKDNLLYGYCTDSSCQYYNKNKKCNILLGELYIEDEEYNANEDYEEYESYGYYNMPGMPTDGISSNLVKYEFEGTGSTSYNKTTSSPTEAGTYKITCTIPLGDGAVMNDGSKNIIISKEFTIYKYYEVTFEPGDGASFNSLPSGEVITKYVYDGDTVKKPANNPICADRNWVFDSWRIGSENGPKYDFTKTVSGNINLYALFKKSFGDISENDQGIIGNDVANAKGIWITGVTNTSYIGSKITFDNMRVYDGNKLLVEGKDYTVSYKNNLNAASANAVDKKGKKVGPCVIIKGKGNYNMTYTQYFTIDPVGIPMPVDGVSIHKVYTGKAIKHVPTIKSWDGKTLKANKDFKVTYTDLSGNEVVPKDEGQYNITVTGIGNYYDGGTISLYIEKKTDISKVKVTGFKKSIEWPVEAGNLCEEVSQNITLAYKGTPLSESDYEIEYVNANRVGTATIIISGKGKYTGSKTLTYKITGTSIAKAKVVWAKEANNGALLYGECPSYGYGCDMYGNKVILSMNKAIKYIDKKTTTVKNMSKWYKNVTNKASFTVYANPYYGYSGQKTIKYKIVPYDVAVDKYDVVDIDVDTYADYSKAGAKAKVSVALGSMTLKEGTDYTLKYKNNKKVGTGTVTIKFKGNFAGTVTRNFIIDKAQIYSEPLRDYEELDNVINNDCSVAVIIPNAAYKKKAGAYRVNPIVFEIGTNKILKAGKDYTVTYYSESDCELDKKTVLNKGDKVYMYIYGIGNYEGYVYDSYKLVDSSIANSQAVVKSKSYTGSPVYLTADDGKNKNPDLTIYADKKKTIKLTEGEDYKIVSYANNVKKGKASVTIMGIGKYAGTKTITFKITGRSVETNINEELIHLNLMDN